MRHVSILSLCIFFAVMSKLFLTDAQDLPAESSTDLRAELRDQQITVYSEIFEITKKAEKSGEVSREDVINAYLAYTDARLSLASSQEERLNLLDERVSAHRDLEHLRKQYSEDGSVSRVRYLKAVAERIGAEIDLANEQQKQQPKR